MYSWSLILAGLAAGTHAATWGAHKDTPFEGFRVGSFWRSPLIGLVAALALAPFIATAPMVVTLAVIYTAERLATEWWKTIWRHDDQSAYAIPMRLGVGGRPVDDPRRRHAAGLAIAAGFALACVLASQVSTSHWPWWATVLAVGSSGWFIAFGGAWKDAPVEGFSPAKFVRSPFVATLCALLVVNFTDNLALLMLASGGYSVAAIETYKTFVNRGAPGKFADKPVVSHDEDVRRRAAVIHAFLWLLFAGLVLTQLSRVGVMGDAALFTAAGAAVIGGTAALSRRVGAGAGAASAPTANLAVASDA